jgi:hypothetical protein
MKQRNLLFALIFLLAACSSSADPQALTLPKYNENLAQENIEPNIPSDSNPAEEKDFEGDIQNPQSQTVFAGQLQSFFLDNDNVKVIETRETEWLDSCLGIDQPGVDCIPQPTQGYEITLEANGLQFEYHADHAGGHVHPATIGLIWSRQGGENKLCDRLIIYLPDEAHVSWCNSGEMHTTEVKLQEILSMEEYDQFIELLKHYNKHSINDSATLGSKPVEVSLMFHGQGDISPQTAEQETLLTMAEKIFSRISP